jgi:hypothetical protein
MNTQLTEDIIVHHLFPGLSLSKVIEITEARPSLLPKTKEYLLTLGRSIGICDPKEAKDVLKALCIDKDVRKEFKNFKSYFVNDIRNFLYTWVDEEVYQELDDDYVLYSLENTFDSMYPEFERDWNANLDIVFDKKIIRPELYQCKIDKDIPIFSRFFPNFYREFYKKIELFFQNEIVVDNYDPSIFRDIDGNLHPIIRNNTEYNANHVFHQMLFVTFII